MFKSNALCTAVLFNIKLLHHVNTSYPNPKYLLHGFIFRLLLKITELVFHQGLIEFFYVQRTFQQTPSNKSCNLHCLRHTLRLANFSIYIRPRSHLHSILTCQGLACYHEGGRLGSEQALAPWCCNDPRCSSEYSIEQFFTLRRSRLRVSFQQHQFVSTCLESNVVLTRTE